MLTSSRIISFDLPPFLFLVDWVLLFRFLYARSSINTCIPGIYSTRANILCFDVFFSNVLVSLFWFSMFFFCYSTWCFMFHVCVFFFSRLSFFIAFLCRRFLLQRFLCRSCVVFLYHSENAHGSGIALFCLSSALLFSFLRFIWRKMLDFSFSLAMCCASVLQQRRRWYGMVPRGTGSGPSLDTRGPFGESPWMIQACSQPQVCQPLFFVSQFVSVKLVHSNGISSIIRSNTSSSSSSI